MSHAANLRNHQRSLQESSPAKRRKLSVDHSQSLLNGSSPLINGHGPTILAATPTPRAKSARRSNAQFSQAVVTSPDAEPQTNGHISSDEDANGAGSEVDDDASSDDEEDIDDEAAREEQSHTTRHKPILEDEATIGTQEAADVDEAVDDEATEEPSFGELLRARAPGVVDVEAAFQHTNLPPTSLLPISSAKYLTAPTATSLSTVLTQALRTNDADLLESCFHVPDLESIRATIERLHSSLAVQLVQRLAERMHRRPGRAGSLMVWVQWTVVAHGGYLASQPAAMKHLRTLYKVVKLRATGLQPLLALKGKLDMLEAQMQMRRNVMAAARAAEDRHDEAATVYIEGEEDEEDDAEYNDASDDADVAADEDDPDALLADLLPRRVRTASTRDRSAVGGDADVPILNGTLIDDEAADGDSSDEEDDEEDDDLSSDDDASSAASDGLSNDEQNVNYDDVDEAELGSEDEDDEEDDEGLDVHGGLADDVDSEEEPAEVQGKKSRRSR